VEPARKEGHRKKPLLEIDEAAWRLRRRNNGVTPLLRVAYRHSKHQQPHGQDERRRLAEELKGLCAAGRFGEVLDRVDGCLPKDDAGEFIAEGERSDVVHDLLAHLAEEMMARENLTSLPLTDCAHLSGDLNRVYHLLIMEWLTYMQYLKHNYPYLFSLAMRKNPFDRNASVVVQ